MTLFKLFLCGLTLVWASGCAMKWHPATESAHDNIPTPQSQILLAEADACFDHAEELATLNRCVDQYRAVVDVNPGDYAALTKLSTLQILIGTAYTDSSGAKSTAFRRAMRYAEQAMYTNPRFRERVLAGEPLWEAVDALGKDELHAMFFWVTALQYEFKEGMSLPAKIANIEWLQHALTVLNRIEALDPQFGGGGVAFAKVICYYALPERFGGSKALGDTYMRAAVEQNQNWLLPRWARGKYYYAINDQPEKSRQELSWVSSQNPDDYLDPYPWRQHFMEDSVRLLQE